MLPQGLFGIPPFLLLAPIATGLSFWVFLRSVRREGLNERRVLTFQLLVAVCALGGAKAFSLLFEFGWNPLDAGNEELAGGWRYPGGLAGLVLALLLLKPRMLPEVSLARYADLVIPAAAVAVGIFRFHCFLQGCCVGDVCRQFFCLSYAPLSEVWSHQIHGKLIEGHSWSATVLPLHFLFMAASLGTAWFLLRFDPRRSYDGQIFLLYLAIHEGLKASLELLREPPSLLLQLSSLVPALIGIALLARNARRGARAGGN